MFPEGTFGMGNCDCSPWKSDSELVFSSQGTDTPYDLCFTRSTLGSYTIKHLETCHRLGEYPQKVFSD